MMYSTQKNITRNAPQCNGPSHVVGTYLRYPDQGGKRIAEGGLRLQGLFKRSLPDQPLVTVITVCLNSAKTLEQCIQSVLGQTYANIEYLIIDACSSDGTLDLIRQYENAVDYYLSEPDRGIYHAMNKGLTLASGHYILFLNADDWYESEAVELLVNAQREKGCDFVSALANYTDNNGKFLRIQPSSPLDASVDFRMPLRHETMLLSAEIYEAIGPYDESYPVIADRILTANLFWKGYTHYEIPKPLLNFRISGVSSVNLDKLYYDRRRALEERYPGLSLSAVLDMMTLEKLTPERLCEISRNYKSAEFRAAARAYVIDRANQGDKAWQGIDLDAFSPVLRKRPLYKAGMAVHKPKPKPKISIILPVYNAEGTLEECLDSILAQTFTDFEVICINDQSPDDSQAIIDAYAKRDGRIHVRKNEINSGCGATRNRGVFLAKGDYIFNIDPDDVIPPNALEVLYKYAVKYGSELTKGSFIHNQMLLGQKGEPVRKGLDENAPHVVNFTLRENPEYLKTTEGHWSYLYKASLAKRIFWPEDLKMGQDSLFIVQALVRARSISIIPDVVYHYRANPNSAMNSYNFQKIMDEIEWRRRAWSLLNKEGFQEIGDFLLYNYWNAPFFENMRKNFTLEQNALFFNKLRSAFRDANGFTLEKTRNPIIREIFERGFREFSITNVSGGHALPDPGKIKIRAISTSDHGGAGLASLRCIESLCANGEDVLLAVLFKKTSSPNVIRLPTTVPASDAQIHQNWRKTAVLTKNDLPTLQARELFSKTGSVVDIHKLRQILRDADVIHLHWVVGMFDFEKLPGIIGSRPVVWTLHDMNPFTGGCHYSENCEGYKLECKDCPLLGGKSQYAHEAWKVKRKAYEKLINLHIVCPSQWIANCARESSLFRNRPIHVIPNIFPSGHFRPTNKFVARLRLGLPVNKKLIAFGADSLGNRRKGGDLFVDAITRLKEIGDAENVEVLFFGSGRLEIDIKSHLMGYISDPNRLSLIYAAADVFAFPSLEDNAPQTIIESLLSGTPVVAFPVGIVTELITHERTGYIAKYADSEDFANGLAWGIRDAHSPGALLRGIRGHINARVHNDHETAMKRHLELFRKIAGRE